MKKIIVTILVVGFLVGFGQIVSTFANGTWNEFMQVMKTVPENDKARIAQIPNSPPTNNEQVQALREVKRLLLIDLREYQKEMNSWRGRQSSAASQAFAVTEKKLNDVNRLLSIASKQGGMPVASPSERPAPPPANAGFSQPSNVETWFFRLGYDGKSGLYTLYAGHGDMLPFFMPNTPVAKKILSVCKVGDYCRLKFSYTPTSIPGYINPWRVDQIIAVRKATKQEWLKDMEKY